MKHIMSCKGAVVIVNSSVSVSEIEQCTEGLIPEDRLLFYGAVACYHIYQNRWSEHRVVIVHCNIRRNHGVRDELK